MDSDDEIAQSSSPRQLKKVTTSLSSDSPSDYMLFLIYLLTQAKFMYVFVIVLYRRDFY